LKNALTKVSYEEPESNLFDSPCKLERAEPDSTLSRPGDFNDYAGSPGEAETPLSKLILKSNRQSSIDAPLKVITNSVISNSIAQPRKKETSLPRPHGPQSAVPKIVGRAY